MHTTVFQAEIIAINEACKKFIDTKQSNMQFIKIFSDSQAAILALNSNTVTSSLVKQTIITLNLLADSTKRVEICWIKAHIGHDGNERADQLAREAVKNSQVGGNHSTKLGLLQSPAKKKKSTANGNEDGQMIMHTG